jgi:hypothetical protein
VYAQISSAYRRKLPALFFSDLHGLAWRGLDGVQSSRLDLLQFCNDSSRTGSGEESNGLHIDSAARRWSMEYVSGEVHQESST